MQWPADYHMHTPLCQHAQGEPEEYAAHALKVGLTEIGFSDHSPMRQDGFDNWRMRLDQLDEYVEKVVRVRERFPNLTVKLALEVDFLPDQTDWIRELAARHPWDYFIGSVHYVANSWDVDNPQKLEEWSKRDVNDVWQVYLERLILSAESGLFEIIGHCDLAKKFCHYPTRDFLPLYDRFLQAAARTHTAIELNTAGLRKDCREIYPARAILERAYAHGVAITFGSDAHAPAEVGADFARAVGLAQNVGYKTCLRFTRRQRTVCKL